MNTLRGFLFCCLLVASPTGSSLLPSSEPAGAEIVVDRNERVSRDEARFRLKVTNRSDRPVFLTGMYYESGPSLDPVYLEQWRPQKGWEIVVPCMDTPPPHVIKLNPGDAMTFPRTLVSRRSAVCKVRTVRFESKFRFRLEYFDSEQQARTYMDNLFGGTGEEVKPRIAISETFEIPPTPSRSRLSPHPSSEPAGAEIVVEQVKRVSRDEVHFWLKVTNRSDRPVFLAGINYESGPRPELVFIEKWRAKEGWKTSYCMDTPPPHVIKLNPGEAITQVLWGKLPMSVICRNPITKFEGKFRFRLEYFDSEKQVRTYIDNLFGGTGEKVKPRIAISKTFEIPPVPNPED